MRILVKLIIIALFIGIVIWLFLRLDTSPDSHIADINPCETPVTYQIGEIDTRFGITNQVIRELMEEATQVWSEAAGLPVAFYSEGGDVVIQFVYDERQKMTESEMDLRNRIDSEQLRYESMKITYDHLLADYNRRLDSFNTKVNQYRTKVDQHNSWVNRQNEQGGFSDAGMTELLRRQGEIDREELQLEREEAELRELAERLNEESERLNRNLTEQNKLIAEYNASFAGVSSFNQGEYIEAGRDKSINIYRFLNKNDLRLVLAHELGHALGIGHVSNSGSIMFHRMGDQILYPLQLSPEDREAIRERCL